MEKLKQYKLKRGIAISLIAVSAVLLILFAVACFLFGINRFSLTVRLSGEPEMELEYGESYQEPGADVYLVGSLVFRSGIPVDSEVTSSGTVNSDVLGTYEITYETAWGYWKATQTRTVQVVDKIAPLITIVTLEDQLTVVGEPYVEEGYSAVDEYDGDLTDRVTAVEGNGVVTYRVTDHSGNETVVHRQIRYYDPIAPELVLTGGTVTVPAGEDYIEPGYSAWDNGDGDITDWVEIFSDYNKYLAGTYKMTYVVSDTYGKTTTMEREIVVTSKGIPESVMPEGKIIYLTFDDGPSDHTRKLLEILKRNEVQATFFVCNRDEIDVLPEMVAQGHTVAVHSRSHNFGKVYESVDIFFDDMLYMRNRIYELTGVQTNLIRFPGGSSNTVSSFNKGIMTRLTQAVTDMGYQYFDWNVDSNDAGGARDSDTVFENVVTGVQWQRVSIVLQHDTQDFSVDAVERIICWGLENGYRFLPLEPNSPGCHHEVNN